MSIYKDMKPSESVLVTLFIREKPINVMLEMSANENICRP